MMAHETSGGEVAQGVQEPGDRDRPGQGAAPLDGDSSAGGTRLRAWRAQAQKQATARLVEGQVLWGKVRARGGSKAARLLGLASAHLPPNPLGGLCGIADEMPLCAENVILGYAQGLFPMDFHGRLRWHCPSPRFVLSLDSLRISAKMRRDLRKSPYTYSFDQAPRDVLDACADRVEGTWLSERLKGIFLELHELGAMHSVEAWQDGVLVGGSFGLSIGRVWTGETMFHRAPNAGKAQFVHLASHLQTRGYRCVDGQSYSNHFARFGAREIPLAEYRGILARGLANPTTFYPPAAEAVAGG